MQEEMTSQSITLSAKTVEMSIDVLKKIFDIYLDNQKKVITRKAQKRRLNSTK